MTSISSWMLSIAGVVFIGTIFELLLPHKRLKNSINICIVVILISSLFVPIVNFLKPNHLNDFELDIENVIAQDNFYAEMVDNLEKQVERKLLSQLEVESLVDIEYILDEEKLVFSGVDVLLRDGFGEWTVEEVIIVVQSIVNVGNDEVFVHE